MAIGNPDAKCSTELRFDNMQDMPVGPRLLVDLQAGQSAFVYLNMSTQVSRFGERGGICPCIVPGSRGSAARCVVSAQLFDQFTGWTTAYMGAAKE